MNLRILLLALLAIFARAELYAQADCTTPPDCIMNRGTNSSNPAVPAVMKGHLINSVGYMLPGWEVFKGTPIYGDGMNTSTGIEMVSDDFAGEGVYACYDFRAGRRYKVCWYAKNTTTRTGGNLIFEAANATGTPATIYNQVFYQGGGYTQYHSAIFAPTQNYTRLRISTNWSGWISPNNPTPPYAVVVDDIQITEVPTLTASPATITACSGSSTLTANSQKWLGINWSPSVGLSSTSGTPVTASPCSTMTYTATYSNGCEGSCTYSDQTITVNVNAASITATASPSTISPCQSSTLSVNPSNATVTWSPTTGLSSPTGSSVTARPCATTTYTATIRCVSGCTYTRTATVIVNQAGLSATASPATITGCQSATLTASSPAPMSVTWAPVTNLTPTMGNVVSVIPCVSTTYTATFACAANGCTYTRPVTVNVAPGPGIINPSATIPCRAPIKMYFAGNGCASNTYKWTGPRGGTTLSTTDTLSIPSPTPGDQGTYTLQVITPQGCTTTHTSIVTMTNCCNINGDFTIVGCNPIRLVNNTTMDGVPVIQGEWYWDFGDGNVSTIRNPSHRYTQSLAPRKICMTVVAFDSSGTSTCCDKVCKDLEVCSYANNCEPRAAFDFNVINPVTHQVQLIDRSIGAGTPVNWVWRVDTVLIPGTTNNSPIVTMGTGMHTVCLKVTYSLNGGTCEEQWCEQVYIP